MARVTVRIPGLLAPFADDKRVHEVSAATADASLDAVIIANPALEPHVLDQTGTLREHLQLYVDGRNVDWLDADPVPVSDGATVELFQAVSGG